MYLPQPDDRREIAMCGSQLFVYKPCFSYILHKRILNNLPILSYFILKLIEAGRYVVVPVVNYDVSNTVALETRWFTTVSAMYVSPICVSTGSNYGLLPVWNQAIIQDNAGILLIRFRIQSL